VSKNPLVNFLTRGALLHLFIRRTLRKGYLPLLATLDDRLEGLTAE